MAKKQPDAECEMKVPKTPTRIGLPSAVREKVGAMVAQLDNYLAAVRDTLGVPHGWILERDQRGAPVAFVQRPQATDAADKKPA